MNNNDFQELNDVQSELQIGEDYNMLIQSWSFSTTYWTAKFKRGRNPERIKLRQAMVSQWGYMVCIFQVAGVEDFYHSRLNLKFRCQLYCQIQGGNLIGGTVFTMQQ